jgi:hypothetical protein
MSDAQTKAKRTKTADERDVWSPDLPARDKIRPKDRSTYDHSDDGRARRAAALGDVGLNKAFTKDM